MPSTDKRRIYPSIIYYEIEFPINPLGIDYFILFFNQDFLSSGDNQYLIKPIRFEKKEIKDFYIETISKINGKDNCTIKL